MSAVHATTSFLAAVARRAWLVKSVEHARNALWVSGIALFVLSLFHVIGFPVSTRLILLALAAIALWTLFRIAASRVTSTTAATLADHAFAGHSLMTTAVECLPNARLANSEASGVVLDQADARAREWQPQIKQRIRKSPRTTSALAMIPMFVAVVLLSLQPRNDVTVIEVDDAQPATEAGDPNDVTEDVDTLRRALMADVGAAADHDRGRNAAPTDTVGAAASRDVGAAFLPRDDRDSNVPPTEGEKHETPAGAASSRDRSGEDPGDLAGTALPGNFETRDSAPAELAAGKSVFLERRGEGTASTDRSDNQYRAATAAPPWLAAQALPAAAPGHTHTRTTLSPAQAAYAARYLADTGDPHEQTDD